MLRGASPAGPSPLNAGLTLPAAAAGDASALPGEHQPSRAQPVPMGALSTGAVPTEAGAHQAAGGGPPMQGLAGSNESRGSGAAQVHLKQDGRPGQLRAPSPSPVAPAQVAPAMEQHMVQQVGVLPVGDERLPAVL